MDNLDAYLERKMLSSDISRDTYHYSRHGDDIKEFGSYDDNVGIFDSIGVHTGSLPTINHLYEGWGKRGDNGGIVYPLEIKTENPLLNEDGSIKTEVEMYQYLEKMMEKIGEETGLETWRREIKQKVRDIIWSKYDVIPYVNAVEAKGEISYISPSESISFKLLNNVKTKQTKKIKLV